jgi:hypothetical protein
MPDACSMWRLGFMRWRQIFVDLQCSRLRLKCDGTRTETRFRLSAKRASPFKSAGASVQSTTGSRGVRISISNTGYTMFWGSVKSTGYPLHSPVSPSLLVPCVTLCHHISAGVYMLLVTLLASRIIRWLQDFRKVCMYRTGSCIVTFVRYVFFVGNKFLRNVGTLLQGGSSYYSFFLVSSLRSFSCPAEFSCLWAPR